MKRRRKQVSLANPNKRSLKAFYEKLGDLVQAFKEMKNTSGWILHQYRYWICFAIHSIEFEDPDIKVVIKNSLDYKIIVAGLLLDTRLPSLRTNELKSVLSCAELAYQNLCCGFKEVAHPEKFNVYHRRYSYDVFAAQLEKPRYETIYRSPFCTGQSVKQACSFCTRLKNETSAKAVEFIFEVKEVNENIEAADGANASKFLLHGNEIEDAADNSAALKILT